MTKKPLRQILLIEDNLQDVGLLRAMLWEESPSNSALTHVQSMSEAEEHLATRPTDLILLDLGLPDVQGLEAVRRVRAAAPQVALVVLTGSDDETLAMQTLHEGAQDYLIKGQIEARGFLRALHYATERIKAQRENIENRRVFEDLFNNSDAAVIDRDFSALFRMVQKLKRQGVRDLRDYIAESDERLRELVAAVAMNGANAAALRIFGVSTPQEIDTQEGKIVDIAEAIFLGTESIKSSDYLTSSDPPIPVLYSLRIPRTEEDARRVPIIIIDLSNVRLAEAARQASLAKSQFLSSMSHEIRTPLNGVIGNLELLALTALDEEQSELLDDADKAAQALLGLVGNILDFSKIEAGKLTIELGEINPVSVVEEAVDVLQSRARQKNLFIAATFGCDVPTQVRGDGTRLRQILLNLIGNAVKFTEQGGVQVNLVAGSRRGAALELRFEVQDSGRGFDPAQATRLFEPFAREDGPVHGIEGTGLGLSICQSLVDALGGAIGCEAVPGEGASFWFTLPTEAIHDAPSTPRPDLSGVRVAFIGRDDPAPISLEAYFRARGATIMPETDRTTLACAASRNGQPHVDVAVLVADGNDDDASDIARRLRDRHIVPLVYGVDQSARARLRQGFAAVITPETAFDYLDRNIRLLVGHAQARNRLAARQVALVSDFGPTISGARVLVLEDRLVNQTVIRKQLKKLGIDCTLAANGLKGLEALDNQEFDLILCDCSMPEMNGYDFTRVLRLREATAGDDRRLPVVALTANAFREDAEKCFEAGMSDFMSKPVTMDRLAAVLARWLAPPGSAMAAGSPTDTVETTMAPMIDLVGLAEILGTDEPDTLNQVLVDFMSVVGLSLAEVAAAVASGDPAGIQAAAHGAKGEAQCAAATLLADLYAELYRQAKDGDPALSRWLLDQATSEVRRVEEFIRRRLRAPPP